jgi:hypothetical protein
MLKKNLCGATAQLVRHGVHHDDILCFVHQSFLLHCSAAACTQQVIIPFSEHDELATGTDWPI